jgi:hypothetical protein
MRIRHYIIINAAVLAAIFVTGCSKSPGVQAQPVTAPATTTNLGAVELTPRIPKLFSLSDGRSCSLTGKWLTNGIAVKLAIVATNADGSLRHSYGEIDTLPGQQCTISIGDTTVGLTPTLKTP